MGGRIRTAVDAASCAERVGLRRYAFAMIDVLRTVGRALARHWPMLLAWYLAGTLVHLGMIQLAGFVGGYNAIAGLVFLLPLAAIAKLVSFVAMFLVVRDSLRELSAIAPTPEDPAARRAAFLGALMTSVLPFLAFYAAWGFQREDAYAQAGIAWSVYQGEYWSDVRFTTDGARPELLSMEGRVLDTSDYTTMITILVIAFALRWLWKRYRAKLPKWTIIGALYLEAVWIYLAVSIIADGVKFVTGWVDTRVGMVWLDGITTWFSTHLAWFAAVWDGIVWLLGELGGLTLLPLAWLTIAGVIYGQAVSAQAPALHQRHLDRARSEYEKVDSRVRSRVRDLAAPVTDRFSPIWDAFVLMFRAGPLLVGGYVLLYALWIFADEWLQVFVRQALGPHELMFWAGLGDLPIWLVALVMEPLRIVIVAAVYDRTIGSLPREVKAAVAADTAASEAAAEAVSALDAAVPDQAAVEADAVAEAIADVTGETP